MQTFPAATIAASSPNSATTRRPDRATEEAIAYLRTLFAAPRSAEHGWQSNALGAAIPEARVRAVATAWTGAVLTPLAQNSARPRS